MDFVTEMFYRHEESAEDMAPLLTGAEYREAEEHLTGLLEAVSNKGLSDDIRQAALDFADVLALFFYRTGIKDGASVFNAA